MAHVQAWPKNLNTKILLQKSLWLYSKYGIYAVNKIFLQDVKIVVYPNVVLHQQLFIIFVVNKYCSNLSTFKINVCLLVVNAAVNTHLPNILRTELKMTA